MSIAVELVGRLLYAGPVLFVLVGLCVLAIRTPRTYLGVILIAFLLTNVQLTGVTDQTTLQSSAVSVYPMDFLSLVCVVALPVLMLRRNLNGWRAPIAAALLTLMVLWATLMAVAQLGLQPGVNAWRDWIWSLALFWWAFVALPPLGKRALDPFVWVGLLASLLQLVRYAMTGFGTVNESVVLDGTIVGARPLSAGAALLMPAAMFIILSRERRLTAVPLMGALWLFGSTVTAQHRSVWIGTLLGLVTLALIWARTSRHPAFASTGVVLTGLFGSVAMYAIGSASSALSIAATNTATWNYRVELWINRLSVPRPISRWISGEVLSPLNTVEYNEVYLIPISSHSFLVDGVLRLGLLGTLCATAVWLLAVFRCPRNWRTSLLPIYFLFLGFSLAYQWTPWFWLILGLGLGPIKKVSELPLRSTVRPAGPDRWEVARPVMMA